MVDYESLLSQTDYILKVKVLDELSANNSFSNDNKGVITDFYSIRSIEILDAFGKEITLDKIFVSEAKTDGNIYKYSDSRTLKKNGIYLIYLGKSSEVDGYVIPNYEGAIVNLEEQFKESSPEVTLSDFNSLLIANGGDAGLVEHAVYIPGIKELSSSDKYNVTVDNTSVDYYVSAYEDKTSLLEINNHQYLIDKVD